ncbi:MAG: molybdopterin molybdotransferase MoeA, partial [Dehalococcoidales bacterium]|nr:molybdopterin molybdotransferase MoeA [Dehalococcoidales bacterium]
MISVEQALDRILGYIRVLDSDEVPILDCLGQVLAEEVSATFNIPPRDNSAMDGYAVRSQDTQGASRQSPRRLRVLGTAAAGAVSDYALLPGTAVRIMTGAFLPQGADSVVRFEDTDEASREGMAEIGIQREVAEGWDIRRAGEDIARGARVLGRGTVISPAEIGVLASLGRTTVRVIRRPVVAILTTGDELVDAGEPLPEGKIYNSNGYSLAALVRFYGGIPKMLGIARDSETSVVAGLRGGLDADMLVTSGGVSRGDYDVVKDVLAKQGEISFWTVCMKPGKPLAFGVIKGDRDIPHLGLPGNPVSVMVTFEMFVRPAILKMLGKQPLNKPTIDAIIENTVANTDGRRVYARVIVSKRQGQYFARLTGPQGSGILTSVSRANG